MLATAGDSHTDIFCRNPAVKWMPDIPTTAYQLCNPDSRLKAGQKILEFAKALSAQDTLLLSAGEIDCRIHMWHVHVRDNRRLWNVMDETVDRLSIYVNTLLENCKCRVVLLGIPPLGNQGNFYKYPNWPNDQQHVMLYKVFWGKCMEYPFGARYVDMYSPFVGNDGHAKPEFLQEDGIHLKGAVTSYILEQVEK